MRMSSLVRLSAVAAAAASLVMLPTAAFAGEVTGNGGETGAPRHAASECAFSGLEDVVGSPLRTQTPHEVYADFLTPPRVINPAPGTPGMACNPAKVGRR